MRSALLSFRKRLGWLPLWESASRVSPITAPKPQCGSVNQPLKQHAAPVCSCRRETRGIDFYIAETCHHLTSPSFAAAPFLASPSIAIAIASAPPYNAFFPPTRRGLKLSHLKRFNGPIRSLFYACALLSTAIDCFTGAKSRGGQGNGSWRNETKGTAEVQHNHGRGCRRMRKSSDRIASHRTGEDRTTRVLLYRDCKSWGGLA